MPSVKKNFVYSSILTVSNYIFPLLTYPYISRVLGVTNIGICNYVDSIINYFILFSMMGISVTGIREIAAHKNNQSELNSVFTSLVLLNGIFTLGALVILLIAMYTVPGLYDYRTLLWVGVLKLLGNALLFEWLYKGIEDFKYITKRTIIVKSLYVVSVFIFVREQSDYPLFFLLSALMVVINAAINCLHARGFLKLTKKDITFSPYIKSYLVIGCYLILNSFYTSFNVAYLGFISNPDEVGYYTTATKLFSVVIAIFSAFTGVMLPRMSALFAERKEDEFINLIRKSVDVLLAFSIPVIILFELFATNIMDLFAGKGYEGSYLPAQIVMPLVFIIGYEQILVLQVLMPMKRDRATFANSITGAIVGIVANIALVPVFKAVGAAIVWVCSEVAVLICAQYWTTKYLDFRFPWKLTVKYIVTYIPSVCVCVAVYYFVKNVYISFFIDITLLFIYTCFAQKYALKNEVCMSLFNKFTSYIRHDF